MRKMLRILFLFGVAVCAEFLLTQCCDLGTTTIFVTCFNAQILDNSGEYPQISADDEVESEVFGIRLVFSNKADFCLRRRQGLFFSSSYASVCEVNYEFSEQVTELHCLTGSVFDASHPAGSDITEYFHVLDNEYSNRDLMTVSQTVTAGIPVAFSGEESSYSHADLLLMTPPDAAGAHIFS